MIFCFFIICKAKEHKDIRKATINIEIVPFENCVTEINTHIEDDDEIKAGGSFPTVVVTKKVGDFFLMRARGNFFHKKIGTNLHKRT